MPRGCPCFARFKKLNPLLTAAAVRAILRLIVSLLLQRDDAVDGAAEEVVRAGEEAGKARNLVVIPVLAHPLLHDGWVRWMSGPGLDSTVLLMLSAAGVRHRQLRALRGGRPGWRGWEAAPCRTKPLKNNYWRSIKQSHENDWEIQSKWLKIQKLLREKTAIHEEWDEESRG